MKPKFITNSSTGDRIPYLIPPKVIPETRYWMFPFTYIVLDYEEGEYLVVFIERRCTEEYVGEFVTCKAFNDGKEALNYAETLNLYNQLLN